ncbi:amidase [Bradyrhizobium sp. LHD-71]|uniref:amidase n=1 Tax=Bradyrhizobium sp. LHD-71 TaxID=3072141 RepID=UPI00280C6E89|nr:amidase [Bradyrhizobium sp. LHD-71]MDQ8731603.1 amidase [Bradyrhizobium sp. LHD-71]
MTELASLSALALIALFKKKSLSPVEYFDWLGQHVAAWEPSVQALYLYRPEVGRAEAEASAARWSKGVPKGPLDGIPVTVKEIIATAGDPIPFGSAATQLVPAADDAPSVKRLREDGAIIFAKTTCPDYGMLSSGISSFHPTTRNPWDLSKNPGGSSSGAGAAGAAGYGPLHLGTDIGGSIRLPAAWCALFGLKPSFGRVPLDPFYLGRAAGPMTRTVDDAALMMATISRFDPRDGMSLPPASIDWFDLAADVKNLRIGLLLDAGCGMPVEREVREAIVAAAKVFEQAGATIVEVRPVMTREMLDGVDTFFRARSWADFESYTPQARAKILPYILTWAEKGAKMSAAAAIRGYNQTNEIRKSAARLFQSADIVLSPTAPVAAFPAEWPSPLNDPERPFEHIVFTVPWNMAENPAASINCGFTQAGMPIGLQIIGPRFSDLAVMRMAKFYESLRGPITNWPQVT